MVGQEHVVRTLRNAVEQGKVHHAYLFVGSRGTGKTSTAKILAACLNCERGPTVDPCGECESCRAIANATSMDVIEMDAASSNSVDDIRELREKVAYAPASGRYKVYILDEAHMLSTQAWNAFLKTLEEPPPRTVFVLATTEAQKVLPTVVDRCHRFDFARPGVDQIAGVLRRVADRESIEIPDQAIAVIARHATGSFRDALGTLEQLVTYSGTSISIEDVLAVLGVADTEVLFEAVNAVAERDPRAALRLVARVADAGRDPGQLRLDLETHARALLVVQTLQEVPAELRLTADEDERLLAQARAVPGVDVVRLLELLGAAAEAVKAGADPRVQLELALLKAAAPEVDPSMRALQVRLERLEAQIAAAERGAPPAAAPAQAAPPRPEDSAGSPAVSSPQGTRQAEPSARAANPGTSAPPAGSPAASGGPDTGRRLVAVASEGGAAATAASAAVAAPATEPATEPESQPSAPPHRDPKPDVVATEVTPAEAAIAAAVPKDEPKEAAVAAAVLDLDGLCGLWPAVLDTVRERNAMLAALLDGAKPVGLMDDLLTVAFPESADFLKRKADDAEHRQAVSEAIAAVTGSAVRLVYELRAPEPDEEPAAEEEEETLSEDEIVERFVEAFEAEEIEPDEDTENASTEEGPR
jgi:DNA polymerase-3 subunit gamma/tau